MALTNEHTGVVDRLGKTELVHARLQTTFQEIFDLKGQHVIELHAGLVEHTDTHETANERIAFEETLGILLVEGKKLTRMKHQYNVSSHIGCVGCLTEQHDESWRG